MDFAEIIQRIVSLVVVLQVIRAVYSRVVGKKDPGETSVLDRAPQEDSAAARAAFRARLEVRLNELLAEIDGYEALLDQLHGALNSGALNSGALNSGGLSGDEPSTRALRAHLGGALRHDLGLARRTVTESLRDARASGDDALDDLPVIIRAAARAQAAGAALRVAARYVDARRQPKQQKLLIDAGQVAAALLQHWPAREGSGTRGEIDLQAAPVVLVGGDPAVVAGLFGAHPVFVVRDELEDEPTAWAALAGGVARAALAADGALAQAVRAAAGARGEARLPRYEGQRLVFSGTSAWGAWAETTFADAVQVLLLGPAGATALLAALESPEDVDAVVQARPAADGDRLGAAPPPHLRVRVVLHLLERLGFESEARRLGARWQSDHGGEDALARIDLPTTYGEHWSTPTEALLEPGLRLVERLAFGALRGLDAPLAALPGLALTPALQPRVVAQAAAWLEDRAEAGPLRLRLAALVEADRRRAGAGARLVSRLRASLAAHGTHTATAASVAPSTGLALLRDAVVLNEILRRRGGAHGAGSRRGAAAAARSGGSDLRARRA